ncbi:MAG: hypothetical protein C4531_04615 [Desulfurivibrio sp.]|nr:MAG: hypothetical protein C4531_04615 [Desulfurivibrio sp.]
MTAASYRPNKYNNIIALHLNCDFLMIVMLESYRKGQVLRRRTTGRSSFLLQVRAAAKNLGRPVHPASAPIYAMGKSAVCLSSQAGIFPA